MKLLNLLLFTLFIYVSCNTGTEPTNEPVKQAAVISEEEAVAEVVTEQNTMPSASVLTVTGRIDVPPENRAAVTPVFGGYVQKVNVLAGQQVKKGAVLFSLQNPEYLVMQQHYLEAKEQLTYLEADYERLKALSEEKISSTKSYLKAESDYKVMKARAASLKEQLMLTGLPITQIEGGKLFNRIDVRSPISGYVTEVNITKSQYAAALNEAVEIVNLDHIHLELDVFEKDALQVKPGQVLRFAVPESGIQGIAGEVLLVGRQVDQDKRTVEVHGHITDTASYDFIPGMFVTAYIQLEEQVNVLP